MLDHRINRIHERELRLAYKDHSSTYKHLLQLDNSVTIHVRNLQTLTIEMYKIVDGIEHRTLYAVYYLLMIGNKRPTV